MTELGSEPDVCAEDAVSEEARAEARDKCEEEKDECGETVNDDAMMVGLNADNDT